MGVRYHQCKQHLWTQLTTIANVSLLCWLVIPILICCVMIITVLLWTLKPYSASILAYHPLSNTRVDPNATTSDHFRKTPQGHKDTIHLKRQPFGGEIDTTHEDTIWVLGIIDLMDATLGILSFTYINVTWE